jgi:hypothetical protein
VVAGLLAAKELPPEGVDDCVKPGAFRMVLAGMLAFSHTAGPEIGKAAVVKGLFTCLYFWVDAPLDKLRQSWVRRRSTARVA